MTKIDFVKTDCDDLSCHTGVTFMLDCLYVQKCTSIPNNLQGYAAVIKVFDTVDDKPEITLIAEIDGVISAPASGVIHFEMSATDTDKLIIGSYSYHMELMIGTTVYRVAEGIFEVTA